MLGVRTYAAAAAWMTILLSMSACSTLSDFDLSNLDFELFRPPPAVAELPPPPPGPPSTEAEAPGPVYPPSPEEARAEIIRYFTRAGYRDFQIAALVEHARAESGFRSCAAGPAGLSYTFQWGGTRLEQLHEFAKTDGCPQLEKQLAFADSELRNGARFGCFWSATTEREAYAALRRGFGAGTC
jgi:hypothetical protein